LPFKISIFDGEYVFSLLIVLHSILLKGFSQQRVRQLPCFC